MHLLHNKGIYCITNEITKPRYNRKPYVLIKIHKLTI